MIWLAKSRTMRDVQLAMFTRYLGDPHQAIALARRQKDVSNEVDDEVSFPSILNTFQGNINPFFGPSLGLYKLFPKLHENKRICFN